MGQLDRESDIIQDLCIIRKPAVWHRDELHSASLKDHLDESRDILECSYRGESRSNDGSDISVDDRRPATNSDYLQSQHSRSSSNVHEPVDGVGSGDVTHPT